MLCELLFKNKGSSLFAYIKELQFVYNITTLFRHQYLRYNLREEAFVIN